MMRTLLALVIITTGVLVAVSGTASDEIDNQKMTEIGVQTNVSAADPFARLYEEMGEAATLGAVLTPVHWEQGKQVQYVENGRIELDPLTGKARLSPIGEMLGFRTPPIATGQIPPKGDPHRRYHGETGHTIPYMFLSFYDAHGGPDIFGYPIAEFTIEDHHIVQYFQCVRLDYYPESKQVRLGPLGRTALNRAPILKPTAEPTPDRRSARPELCAFVKYPWFNRTSKQTAYVRATDSKGQGIAGLPVHVVISDHKASLTFQASPTDQGGYSSFSFSGEEFEGIVQVNAIVSWQGKEIKARTSYISW